MLFRVFFFFNFFPVFIYFFLSHLKSLSTSYSTRLCIFHRPFCNIKWISCLQSTYFYLKFHFPDFWVKRNEEQTINFDSLIYPCLSITFQYLEIVSKRVWIVGHQKSQPTIHLAEIFWVSYSSGSIFPFNFCWPFSFWQGHVFSV